MSGNNGKKPGPEELEKATAAKIVIRRLRTGGTVAEVENADGYVLTTIDAMGMIEYARARFRLQAESGIIASMQAQAQVQEPKIRPAGLIVPEDLRGPGQG